MSREELLRKLEERLAAGEISEETYREIKARYDAMPEEEPEEPEEKPGEEASEEPPKAPGPPDIPTLVEETVDTVMESVSQTLEATLGDEFHEHMEDVGKHIRRALRHVGPRYDKGRKRVTIRSVGTVSVDEPVEEFRCSGSGKVTSNLKAERVRISGACRIDGDCETEVFQASGAAKVKGDLRAEEFRSSGTTKVGGDLRAEEVSASGMTSVAGSIEAEEVRVGGMLHVNGWVRAQSFRSRGQFEIGEGLEADEVKVLLDRRAEVPIIKGKEIVVRRSRRRGGLRAKTIEGEKVSISGTRANLVRGRDVRLGPQSRVDVVEADKLEVHETARVKERRPFTGREEEAPA